MLFAGEQLQTHVALVREMDLVGGGLDDPVGCDDELLAATGNPVHELVDDSTKVN